MKKKGRKIKKKLKFANKRKINLNNEIKGEMNEMKWNKCKKDNKRNIKKYKVCIELKINKTD